MATGGNGHGSRLRALVADDDELLRNFVRAALNLRGIESVVAADGKEAVAAIQANGSEFHLAVIDICMPGANGFTVAESLRERNPDAHIVLMSGYWEDAPRVELMSGRFLSKPFGLHDFLNTITPAVV